MGVVSPNLFYLMSDVTRLARRAFDRRAAGLGLTRAQWRTLKLIQRNEGVSQSAIAEELEMEAIAVGRVIDRLQQAGFVERRHDPNDRRRWCLHLTERAHEVTDAMQMIADELRTVAFDGVADDDLAAMTRVLESMKDKLLAIPAEKENVA